MKMNMIIDIRDTKHKMQHTELQLQLQKDTYIATKGDNGI